MTDVQDRLFAWTAESRRLAVELDANLASVTHVSDDASPKRWAVVPDKQAISRSDDGTVMGTSGPGYTRHQYRERHYYASLLSRHGESVKVVQARLGHATAAETLDTYFHLWPDSEDRTREAIDAVLGASADLVRTDRALQR